MSYKKKAHSDCLAAGSGLAEANSATNDDNTEVRRLRVAEVERRFTGIDRHLWDELVQTAQEHAAAGRWFNIQGIVEGWRDGGRVTGDGGSFRLNNTDCPILSRLLVEAVPECRGLIEMRKSVYDDIFAERSAAHVAAQEAAS